MRPKRDGAAPRFDRGQSIAHLDKNKFRDDNRPPQLSADPHRVLMMLVARAKKRDVVRSVGKDRSYWRLGVP